MAQSGAGTATRGDSKRARTRAVRRHRCVVEVVVHDAGARQLYGSVLCYNGFNVLSAPDGVNAKKIVASLRPDLILMDFSLPNALGLCRLLRAPLSGQDVPIVAIGTGEEALARAAGCAGYLEVPATPVDVLHLIEEIVGRQPLPGDDPLPWIVSYPLESVPSLLPSAGDEPL
jgi:two-component system, cell cycle response regulator DivK